MDPDAIRPLDVPHADVLSGNIGNLTRVPGQVAPTPNPLPPPPRHSPHGLKRALPTFLPTSRSPRSARRWRPPAR
jgi:hypothetical protein